MIAALLLPLLAGAAPADSAASGAHAAPAPVALTFAEAALRIELNERVYEPGDRGRVRVHVEDDGYLLVFQVDVHGNLRVLFPIDPYDDAYVRGGRRVDIKGRGNREAFSVEPTEGQGWIYAAHSPVPFQVDRFVLGDHWDYRTLSPNRLSESPEPELTELVRGMARASFDYDLVPYVVERERRSTSTVVHHTYYDPFYDSCLGCGYYGPGISVGIHFGRPYRRAYYGGCWDAYWCDPYYYDPYYYRPRRVFVPVYRYYAYHPYRPYRSRPNWGPYRDWFGRGDLGGVPYRDRRDDGRPGVRLVSDNTVYGPPPGGRVRDPLLNTPVRRAAEDGPGYRLAPSPGRVTEPGSGTPSRGGERPEARPSRRAGEPAATPSRGAETPEARPSRRTDDRPAPAIEARPSRPAAERPAGRTPDRRRSDTSDDRSARSDDGGARSEDRGRSGEDRTARPAPPVQRAPARAPERRAEPQARSGGSERPTVRSAPSGGDRSSARGSSGSSGGGRSPASSGGGRRRSP